MSQVRSVSLSLIITTTNSRWGRVVVQLVEALRYKPFEIPDGAIRIFH
jgi:hypothetical protein